METNIFTELSMSAEPVIAILSTLVIVLTGVVVFQWKHTNDKTVPKWVWDSLIVKVEKILDLQKEIDIIISERLKR